jgi:hypothetical protein
MMESQSATGRVYMTKQGSCVNRHVDFDLYDAEKTEQAIQA